MAHDNGMPEDDYGIEQWATEPDPKRGRVRGDFAEIMQISLSDSESQLLLYKQSHRALRKSRALWRRIAFWGIVANACQFVIIFDVWLIIGHAN